MALRDGIIGRAGRYLRSAGLPIVADRRPPLPSRDRTVVGVGPSGCFAGLDAAVTALLPDGGPYRLNLLSKLYEHDRRFHVVRRGEWDLAFYAPEGTGFQPYCDVRGHLSRSFDVVAGMADFAVLAEWGSDPAMPSRLTGLAHSGEPAPGMPSLALTCSQLTRYVRTPFSTRMSGAAGPASQAFGGAVVMFAVDESPSAAASALDVEVRRFSRSTAEIRPVSSAPAETLLADMARGRMMTMAGDSVHLAPEEPLCLRA